MAALIVIPARFAATRLPGKPLLRQTGKFLVQHVYERAKRCRLASDVVIATDDARILEAARRFRGQAVLTSPAHASGTDRIAEVAMQSAFARFNILVNVQGDEPEMDPTTVDAVIRRLQDHPAVPMATAAAPFSDAADIVRPDIVKVVLDQHGFALYFSRSVIPHDRDGVLPTRPVDSAAVRPAATDGSSDWRKSYRQHMGLYAYRRQLLLELAKTPPCALEQLEKLEQLRALYLGARILVVDVPCPSRGIDTPADYAAFVERYRRRGQHRVLTR